ncbi:MAG: glycosyltransferase [Candidatus Acidiferrales bacterium]
MSQDCPRVTVGVPVFNGEPFLAEALESLLSQTFSDLEIVISDNASTDRTEGICRTYGARDPRIRYYRSDTNRGAAWNHNRVFELARGEYFKWNSADDSCAPEFLARCVAGLDKDPSAVMACSSVLEIDEFGEAVKPGFIPSEVVSDSAVERFCRNFQIDHSCFHVYSLIRSHVLRQVGPMGFYTGSDRVLLSHLSLFGRCVLIPDTLLFNRDHPARFTRSFGEKSHQGTVWFDSGAAARKLFPYWREFRGYWEAISRSPLGWKGRLRCYLAMLKWLRYHKDSLLADVFHYPKRWFTRHFIRSRATVRPRIIASSTEKLNNDSMSVTVVLCTYNRCEELRQALQSIAASQMPSSATWEVLVVDNNSTDATAGVVGDFCRRYPGRFRYLFEPKQGKSYALNAGVANANGEILAFVDDDVLIGPRWLRNLTTDLRSGEWAGAAGRILPADNFNPPAWLWWQQCAGMLCANFDLGNQPAELDFDHPSCGANMAFRKAVFEKYGGFRVDLGPSPDRNVPGANEDTEFARRLMKAGESLRYEPLALVHHGIPQARINKQFFLSRWFDFGRASIVERNDHPDVLGIPWDYLSLMRGCVQISAKGVRWVFAGRAHTRFFWRCMVWKEAGMMVELYRRLVGRKVSQTAAL